MPAAAAAPHMRAPSSALSLLEPRSRWVRAVRCARALHRWLAPDDSRPASYSLSSVIAVRCVTAGKSKQAPAAPTLVPERFKLVMHVFNDSARERIP